MIQARVDSQDGGLPLCWAASRFDDAFGRRDPGQSAWHPAPAMEVTLEPQGEELMAFVRMRLCRPVPRRLRTRADMVQFIQIVSELRDPPDRGPWARTQVLPRGAGDQVPGLRTARASLGVPSQSAPPGVSPGRRPCVALSLLAVADALSPNAAGPRGRG